MFGTERLLRNQTNGEGESRQFAAVTMNDNVTRYAKIQSNLSRYEDWESRQNSKMDQTIQDINEIFESMNYKVSKKIYNGKKKSNQPKLIPGCKCSNTPVQRNECKRLQLWKLANIFDFGQINGKQQHIECTTEARCRSSSLSTGMSMGNADEKWYNYLPEAVCNKLQSVDSITSNTSSLREAKSDTATNAYQNLLGVPPPQIIEPSLRTTRSASSGLRHNKQTQLLLHDLISGDICDT